MNRKAGLGRIRLRELLFANMPDIVFSGKDFIPLRVELSDETAISEQPASVLIFDEDGALAATIIAKIEREQGADGGLYPVVKFSVQRNREEPAQAEEPGLFLLPIGS